MQVRRNVVAEQGKKARNRKCFVAVPDGVEVDGVHVEVIGQEGNSGVDRHEE